MKEFEYLIVECDGRNLQSYLNKMGAFGWELIKITDFILNKKELIFKREKFEA